MISFVRSLGIGTQQLSDEAVLHLLDVGIGVHGIGNEASLQREREAELGLLDVAAGDNHFDVAAHQTGHIGGKHGAVCHQAGGIGHQGQKKTQIACFGVLTDALGDEFRNRNDLSPGQRNGRAFPVGGQDRHLAAARRYVAAEHDHFVRVRVETLQGWQMKLLHFVTQQRGNDQIAGRQLRRFPHALQRPFSAQKAGQQLNVVTHVGG